MDFNKFGEIRDKNIDSSFGKEIIVRCSWCGYEIGRVSYVPGEQKVGCPNCGHITHVEVYSSGEVYIH